MLKNIKSRKIFKTVIIIIFFALLVALNPYNFFSKFRGVVFNITYPLQKIFSISANKIYSFGDAISSVGEFKKENEYLMKENQRLRSENTKLKDVAKENDTLRRQLELAPRDDFDLLASSVIGRDLQNGNNWIIIDRGGKDGVKEEMPVIVSDGILVGKVKEVFYGESKVIPITSPSSSINAATIETGAVGVVSGEYGLGMTLDMVLQTDYLKLGDDVVSSEISQSIPKGLLIGTIKEVYPSESHLFQRASIDSPVDLFKQRLVFVIKNKK